MHTFITAFPLDQGKHYIYVHIYLVYMHRSDAYDSRIKVIHEIITIAMILAIKSVHISILRSLNKSMDGNTISGDQGTLRQRINVLRQRINVLK